MTTLLLKLLHKTKHKIVRNSPQQTYRKTPCPQLSCPHRHCFPCSSSPAANWQDKHVTTSIVNAADVFPTLKSGSLNRWKSETCHLWSRSCLEKPCWTPLYFSNWVHSHVFLYISPHYLNSLPGIFLSFPSTCFYPFTPTVIIHEIFSRLCFQFSSLNNTWLLRSLLWHASLNWCWKSSEPFGPKLKGRNSQLLRRSGHVRIRALRSSDIFLED